MKTIINTKIKSSWFTFCALFLLVVSCQEPQVDTTLEEIISAQPTIQSFSPASSPVMGLVTVKGTYLNFVDVAYVGDQKCDVYRKVNSSEIILRVSPANNSGNIRLVTKSEKEAVSSTSLTVTFPVPAVTSDIPSEALVNQTLVLEGTNLNVISKVMFGTHVAPIEFQEEGALVIRVPNSSDADNSLSAYYFDGAGEVSVKIKDGFTIIIPKPTVDVWPSLLKKGQDVTIAGQNMNLVESVKLGEVEITDFTATAESLSFPVPEAVVTGLYDIKLAYAGGTDEVNSTNLPYIGVNFELYFDYGVDDIGTIQVNKAESATLSQLNDPKNVVLSPVAYTGSDFAHLEMSNNSSTVFKHPFSKSANSTWKSLTANFTDPVLHMWINSNNTTPDIQIEIYKNTKATWTQIDTKGEWILVAVRLADLFPGVDTSDEYCRINFRSTVEATTELNLDWVIISDGVLDGIGAVDVTTNFQ